MSAGNERFNAEAAAWDANPDVHRASESALQAILGIYPKMKELKDAGTVDRDGLTVLEIGCGTGLLSLRIAPYVKSLVAIDAAQGMIDALTLKLSAPSTTTTTTTTTTTPANITPLCLLLTDPADPALHGQRFNLVLSHLVLHHIADLRALLATALGCLAPGGWACLTDFQDFGPAARRFHPEAKMAGVERHGIDAAAFAALMEDVGFENVVVSVGWTMEKEVERSPGEWGGVEGRGEFRKPEEGCETQEFPFLVCRGRRSAR